jgi:hypothetical protein
VVAVGVVLVPVVDGTVTVFGGCVTVFVGALTFMSVVELVVELAGLAVLACELVERPLEPSPPEIARAIATPTAATATTARIVSHTRERPPRSSAPQLGQDFARAKTGAPQFVQ